MIAVGELPREATVETLWDRDGATPYQTRAVAGRLRVHIFWRGDRDPDMHDHPADFWTFPLVSYVEEIEHAWSRGHTTWRVVKAFRFHRRKAEFAHRVLGSFEGWAEAEGRKLYPTIGGRPIVTIGWWGKKRREWGFLTPDGWVHWKNYVNQSGWKQ